MPGTIKEYVQKFQLADSWAVCGKGPSIELWEPGNQGNTVAVNEAAFYTKQGLFCCYDEPMFRFCHEQDLPPDIIPFVPPRQCKNYQNRESYYFDYPEIGLGGPSCTGVMALCLAGALGAKEIKLYGFNALNTGDISYRDELMNKNNRKVILPSQVPQFLGVPETLQRISSFADTGEVLYDCLQRRRKELGSNLSM
jgi:hypothetical protein